LETTAAKALKPAKLGPVRGKRGGREENGSCPISEKGWGGLADKLEPPVLQGGKRGDRVGSGGNKNR